MIKSKYSLLIFLIFTSCGNQLVTLHYYNGLDISQNYTWGSSLQIFFMNGYDMKRVKLNDKNFKNELCDIKDKIITKNQIIVPDDGNYTFGFITDKDTLFADNRLEFWRYKDKGVAYKLNDTSKNIILKHYKLNPKQW